MAVTIKELRINALVDSENPDKPGAKYEVRFNKKGFSCSCPDFTHRQRLCKHALAVILTFAENAGLVLIDGRKGKE